MPPLPNILVPPDLFRELNGHLLGLLRSLSAADWHRPTVCPPWTVKDIASHLLDGNLRRLSAQRDAYVPPDAPTGFGSPRELVGYLHRLNSDWTTATRRLSPRVLIDLLESTGRDVADLFAALDPAGKALYSVGWAGEAESQNWFDIAREYTRRWHHQQQMWDAVERPGPIRTRRLYHPVLETFLRALPHTFADTSADEGASVLVRIDGEAGGEWYTTRVGGRWVAGRLETRTPAATVILDQDIAWRVMTKRRTAAEKRQMFPGIRTEGDPALADRALEIVSIMA